MGEWKITRAGWKRPPLQLEHCDLHISFREDCVECSGALRLSVRESPAREVSLDARDLEILSVCEILEDGSRVPAEYSFDEVARKLRVALSREYAAGEKVRIGASVRFVPSGVKLEGIYRDTTPLGCPQQYISAGFPLRMSTASRWPRIFSSPPQERGTSCATRSCTRIPAGL